MNRVWMTIVLLVAMAVQAVAQQVSGKVTDGDGPIDGVAVVELDKAGRVVNQTVTDANGIFQLPLRSNRNKIRVSKDGYKTITESINGRMMVRITMARHAVGGINSIQKIKKPKGEDSKKLLEGHSANGKTTEQWVRVEQLTDTSYILAVALLSTPQQITYPAGRGLLFLDIADRRLARAKCLADAQPTVGMDDTPDIESIIHEQWSWTTSGDLTQRINNSKSTNQRYWMVPCFELTQSMLETLYAKGRDIYRIAIESPEGNYWFLYPTEGWETEMQSIISRIQQSR